MSLLRAHRDLLLDTVLRKAAVSSAIAEGIGEGPSGLKDGLLQAEEGSRQELLVAASRMQIIADRATMRVLSSFCRMGDLHSQGVTSMELIESHREKIPDLDAIYLLMPSKDNVDAVIDDYRLKPQHRQVHIVFARPLSEELMTALASSAMLAPRVRSLMEVPLSFVTLGDRGFHFDMLEALPKLFPKPHPAVIEDIAGRLVDVCRCLQTRAPRIRHAQSDLCEMVASKLHSGLQRHGKAPGLRSAGNAEVPCTLLVVDRSIDMAATLVHDYSYEAMVYDLLDGGVLDAERSLVTLNIDGATKEMLLSDSDPLWERIRYLHFTDATAVLQKALSEFCAEKEEMKDAMEDGNIRTADMKGMLRRARDHKELGIRIQMHLEMLKHLNHRLATNKLTQGVGSIEQDIACGVNKEAKELKPQKMQSDLSNMFAVLEEDHDFSSETKLRLLMLYLSCVANVPSNVSAKLSENARLSDEDQQVLQEMLRARIMDVSDRQRGRIGLGEHRCTKEQKEKFKRIAKQDGFELSRFEPRVKELLEQLAEGRLSDDDFPQLKDAGSDSLRVAAGSSIAPAAGGPVQPDWVLEGDCAAMDSMPAEVSQRIIVFVVGGVTHSELRAGVEVARRLPHSHNAEVLVGGTALLTARQLVRLWRPKSAGGAAADALAAAAAASAAAQAAASADGGIDLT